jgi:hypothetical protein
MYYEHLFPVFSRVRAIHSVQLHIFTFLVPCCDVHYVYDLRVKRCSVRLYYHLFINGVIYATCIFFTYTVVQYDFYIS